MEGKKRGSRLFGLSESAKKARKRERDRVRQRENKKVFMNVDTHKRWVSLADSLSLTPRQLAVELLDAVDAGKIQLGVSEESKQGTSSQTQGEVNTGRGEILVSPGTPKTFPEIGQGTSSQTQGEVNTGRGEILVSPGTPETFPEIGDPFLPPPNVSTPQDAPMAATPAAIGSGSDTRSAISGIDDLGAVVSSDEAAQAAEDRSIVEATSDDDLDVSVAYKVKGDYVYPEDLELEDDVGDDDYDYEADLEAELALVNRGCEGLEILGVGEEVFALSNKDSPHVDDTTRSGLHRRVTSADDANNAKFHIIEECELLRLVEKFHQTCPECNLEPLTISLSPSGSATHVRWTCPSGHITPLCTQRTINRVHTGDMRMAAGLVLSGNNYAKISLMAKYVGFNILNRTTFYQLQNKYICPAVSKLADDMIDGNIRKHAAKEEGVVVLGDGRNDSPGFSAQYLTYVMMEDSTKDILHVEFKDKRQAGRVSTRMEPLAFFETLEKLDEKGLKVREVVTDAHPEITAKIRTKRPNIKHSHDTWHGGKNLGKKISKISAKAANRPLIPWSKDIINHWWFCSQTCEGNELLFKEKWRGLLHHIVDQHTWVSGGGVGPGKCEHGELTQDKAYLLKGSPPHAALAEVIMDRTLLKKVPYYINFRHTGELESVNNHILMYCSKRFSFRYPGYKCRNLLAIIDYQHHKDRAGVLDADGKQKYVARWSKRSNDYVPVKVKVPKTYDYIPGLVKDIISRRLTDSTPLSQLLAKDADDPRLVAPRLAPRSPPPVAEVLQRKHVRRFETAE